MDTAERLLIVFSTVAGRDILIDEVRDKNLVQYLGLNSVDALEVLIRVEGEFGIQIDDDDLSVDLVQSIDTLAAYVEGKKHDIASS